MCIVDQLAALLSKQSQFKGTNVFSVFVTVPWTLDELQFLSLIRSLNQCLAKALANSFGTVGQSLAAGEIE